LTAAPLIGAVPLPADPLRRVKNLNVEKIVNLWNQDLEEHARVFFEQARLVQEWDEKFVDNREKLNQLDVELGRVQTKHEELHLVLNNMEGSQTELEDLLNNIERELMKDRQVKPLDNKRQDAGRYAEEINSQLGQMITRADTIVKQLNASAGQETDSPLARIISVLSTQFDMLEWAEKNTDILDKKLRDAQAILMDARLQ